MLILWLSFIGCNAQNTNKLYIETIKPDTIPKVFAPNFISKRDVSEFGSVFSKNGKEFYFGVNNNNKSEIRYSQLKNGTWTTPVALITHKEYGYNDPFLSSSENKLFYISNMPRNERDTIQDHDIWYSKKINGKWSKPINAGENINSDKNEYYMSFTSNDKMYFSSNKNAEVNRDHDFDIYASVFENGEFQKPIRMSDSINSRRYEADVFIAPDESYMIYCAALKDGYGKGDLYISFKDENSGVWSKSQNMGPSINTEKHELCPFVTWDGEYFFYTSNEDIYWVSSKIIENYK
ncbi:MAG: hypothetical protein COA49_00120 [Bacteroidetes bacterium]|nr:MAG: hypothetical protein COA49_00120 [Bacteroidota bacterium]